MKTGVKLFVASSVTQKKLVEALRQELQQQAQGYDLDLAFEPWFRDDATVPGENTLKALIDHCRGSKETDIEESDFFAAFLTKDETRTLNGVPIKVPRDNCIFELGLFMGGLNFDHRRCFMLVDEAALPSDLGGRTPFPFDEPAEGSTPVQYREAVRDLAAKVWNQIYELKHCPRGNLGLEYITSSDLMKRERPISLNGDLDVDGEVLVNRAQPAEEQKEDVATQVSFNIFRAGIRYRYFFHDLAYGIIARLLYRVVTANPLGNGVSNSGPVPREELLSRLDTMIERFSINLVPSTGPIEFCAHLNVNTNQANCYLRYPFQDKLIHWCKNQDALHIVKGLTELGFEDVECDPLCVFRKTKQLDINDPMHRDKRSNLWTAIKRAFKDRELEKDRDLEERLSQVCFGVKVN